MMQSREEIENYLKDFHAFESNGAAQAPTWLKELRASAIEKFSELGFPTTKQEDWRFTNILPLTKVPFRSVSKKDLPEVRTDDIRKFIIGGASSSLLVFINGYFSNKLSDISSLPDEVVAGSLAEATGIYGEQIQHHLSRHLPLQSHPFAALNTAFIHDGAFVYIPNDCKVASPIQLLFISVSTKEGNAVSYPRNLIIVGEKASATFVESYVALSDDVYFSNTVTEVFVEKESAVD